MDLKPIKASGEFYDALFLSRLADKLQSLGYPVERRGKAFEVVGISTELRDRFSNRTREINEKAEADNITDETAKSQLGRKTRRSKSKDVPPEALPAHWQSRFSASELEQITALPHTERPYRTKLSADEVLHHGVEHFLERDATVRTRKVLEKAIRRGIGELPAPDVLAAAGRQDWIVDGVGYEQLMSTREVLKEEQWMLRFARNGKGQQMPLTTDHTIQRTWLSNEQKQVCLLYTSDAADE